MRSSPPTSPSSMRTPCFVAVPAFTFWMSEVLPAGMSQRLSSYAARTVREARRRELRLGARGMCEHGAMTLSVVTVARRLVLRTPLHPEVVERRGARGGRVRGGHSRRR